MKPANALNPAKVVRSFGLASFTLVTLGLGAVRDRAPQPREAPWVQGNAESTVHEFRQQALLPRIIARCTTGCVRYRRSDWGTDQSGRMTESMQPTSGAEWMYLSDGRHVTFHLATDPDEQRRLLGSWSLFVNARAREVTVLRGQHAPSQEGLDELLIGCEGLAENSLCETLAEEMALASILRFERTGEVLRWRYTLPTDANGWIHEIEWVAGDAPRVIARTLEIPQPSTGSLHSQRSRVVRSEVTEWESRDGLSVPKVVERTVRTVEPGVLELVVGRSRFEVLERRIELTPAERGRIGELTIEKGWSATYQDTACSAVLGENEFTFAGRRYEATRPLSLADLRCPEVILEGAQCLE